jgi:hypothetical protein
MKSIVAVFLCMCGMVYNSSLRADVVLSFSLPQALPTIGIFVDGVDGVEFVPTSDLLVTGLGYYDHQGNGLGHNHPVGIYDTLTQTLVAPSITISGSSPLDATTSFRFEDVTPFILHSGVSYTLAGYTEGPNPDPYIFNPANGLIIGTGVNFVAARNGRSTGLIFPTASSQQGVLQDVTAGPNFRYTVIAAVPEFGSCYLLAPAIGGLIALRYRRNGCLVNAAAM